MAPVILSAVETPSIVNVSETLVTAVSISVLTSEMPRQQGQRSELYRPAVLAGTATTGLPEAGFILTTSPTDSLQQC